MSDELDLECQIKAIQTNKPQKSVNVKKSIRDKYNRRLKWLAEILDDVIIHAEKRLNKDVAGDIRNRDETIEMHRKCKGFRTTLPIKDDDEIDLDSMKNFCEIFDIEFNVDDYK